MITAALIINRAKEAGIVLERRCQRLVWRSQSIPDPSFLALCKMNRVALIDALPDATKQPAPAPAVDLAAFQERAAIMEYDGGLPRGKADQAAAREVGFDTAEALYRAAIEAWRSEIDAAPQTGIGFDRLAAVSLRFLVSDWATKALAAGWDETALFAIHEGQYPKERTDAWGLIPVMAWGVHGCIIEGFSRNACALRTQRGATLLQPRMRANFDQAAPFWRHR